MHCHWCLACARLGHRVDRRPCRLKASTVMLIRRAGNISSWGRVSMDLMPSLHMAPQDGVGGATPIPIKDRNASWKIALGNAGVTVTNITPRVMAVIWRPTTVCGTAQRARCAIQPSSRICKICPQRYAGAGQSKIIMATSMGQHHRRTGANAEDYFK